jgi:cytidine deaminase
MKKIEINIEMDFCQIDELSEQDRDLVERAKQACNNSYARYSGFHVGAAVRLDGGEVVIGANQENAAFPSGLCAERCAVFAAQSAHPEQGLESLAIAARNDKGFTPDPISPCGACRQVVLEMEDRYSHPVRVLLYGEKGVYVIRSVRDLLPLCFVDSNMH